MSAARRLPHATTSVRVRSRWDDCDRYGHVNNAAFLAIVRAAHDRAGLTSGELRALEITYRQPIPPEVMIDVDVVVLEEAASHERIAYTLRVDGRPSADVTAVWELSGPTPRVDLPPVTRDPGSLDRLRRRLAVARVGLILDFVPHHTATDAPWIREHPERYAQRAADPEGYFSVGVVRPARRTVRPTVARPRGR